MQLPDCGRLFFSFRSPFYRVGAHGKARGECNGRGTFRQGLHGRQALLRLASVGGEKESEAGEIDRDPAAWAFADGGNPPLTPPRRGTADRLGTAPKRIRSRPTATPETARAPRARLQQTRRS